MICHVDKNVLCFVLFSCILQGVWNVNISVCAKIAVCICMFPPPQEHQTRPILTQPPLTQTLNRTRTYTTQHNRSTRTFGTSPNIITVYLGAIHRQPSTLLFSNRSWTWLRQPSDRFGGHAWNGLNGTLALSLMADTSANAVKTFVIPLVNPAAPQPPVAVRIQGDAPTPSAVATDAAFAATWPIVLPLLTCDEVIT